jgi:hypothetical protein
LTAYTLINPSAIKTDAQPKAVIVDLTPPTTDQVVITNPQECDREGTSFGTPPDVICGTATDLCGIQDVMVCISHIDEGSGITYYWNGSGWQEDEIFVGATNTDDWSTWCYYGIAACDLESGEYYTVTAAAENCTGMVGYSIPVTFMFDAQPPEVYIDDSFMNGLPVIGEPQPTPYMLRR